MLTNLKGLGSVTNIFKDVVNLVVNFITNKGRYIFIEKVESADGYKKGWFRGGECQ